MLRVDVGVEGCFSGEWFLARMTKDGPDDSKIGFAASSGGEEGSLEGSVLEVTVEPARTR